MRVVLDTNVVISALLFQQGTIATIRQAWIEQKFVPLIDHSCADELIRALAYPKFRLDRRDIQILLADYLPYTTAVEASIEPSVNVPICRDPDDQKFLLLAELGKADVLVTGDRALLEMSGKTGFAVETPVVFLGRLSPSS